jgi:TusA-related sulfurtransferase
MSDTTIIDARGLNCPQPVILARKAIQEAGKEVLEILVDSAVARENVSRLAKNSGWTSTATEEPDGTFRLTLRHDIPR